MDLRIDEATKRRDLRKMKTVATGFLVLAAVVYVVARVAEARGAGAWTPAGPGGRPGGMTETTPGPPDTACAPTPPPTSPASRPPRSPSGGRRCA